MLDIKADQLAMMLILTQTDDNQKKSKALEMLEYILYRLAI